MRTVFTSAALAAALLLAGAAVQAQDKPGDKPATEEKIPKGRPAADEKLLDDTPGVHRLEIYNGSMRSVHYVYRGLSPSEAQAVRELERAENENIMTSDMLALRMQYIAGEKSFDSQRRGSQQQLYGYSSSGSDTGSFSVGRRYGEFGRLSTFPFYYGGFGGGWGMGGYGSSSSSVSAGFTSSDSIGLGQGVGDEGRIKTALAPIVAAQATPEYASKVSQDLYTAAAKANSLPVVRDQVGKRELGTPAATPEKGLKAILTRVLDGKTEKIEGKNLKEEGEWFVLDTKQGKRRLLKSTVVDVLETSDP